MRTLLLALLMAAALGCDCGNVATPCSAMSGTAVVFVGRVFTNSETTRVAIEERLYNVPKDLQEVEISTVGCQLESDESYVIFAGREEDGEIIELSEGAYQVTVAKDGLVLEPEAATVKSDARSCQVLQLDMWPSGRISGTIFDSQEKSLEGVMVQAFAAETLDLLRTATTDSQGTYALGPLPRGKYIVGVNAGPSTDEGPYPPTKREDVEITDGAQVDGINLTLPPARTAAKLRFYVTGLSGQPQSGALVNLTSDDGIQRWFSDDKTTINGWLEAPVYVGEQYLASAWKNDESTQRTDILFGNAAIDVTGDNLLLTITLDHKHRRVE
jgi:Carboxypeptidase regulatory-like domain